MVRLREIPRTATFAWSPGSTLPLIATGTRAGAVDADFSNETVLELWDLGLEKTGGSQELQPSARIATDSGFHDIAWGRLHDDYPRGIIAGALENGSLDLWNAEKLLDGSSDAHMSRTSKHSGAVKTVQFNPFRSELLASAGAKGELFISDLNNVSNPFRLGNTAARADDIECLDWNKKVPHIMVTGSSGGFVTVWDVKAKKESLTLNNLGRKAVSAVAWDPDKPTKLMTAIPLDTDPLILLWDLRNSNAPEKVLRGHDQGVLSLSWCPQDNDLMLSCGKDNRTICWNPNTNQPYGEFPVVTNWTFQTRWNPHNPNLFATASFDGKIAVQTIQSIKLDKSQETADPAQALDGEDFFSKAQTQPQADTFSLPKPPKWMEPPVAVSFGFGGKVVSIMPGEGPRSSKIRISTFEVDAKVGTATEGFEEELKAGNLRNICESRVASATTDEERADWRVIETLISDNPRQSLVGYLGFSDEADEAADGLAKLGLSEEKADTLAAPQVNGSSAKTHNRLSSFFDNADGDSFLSDLAASKGAKTNNPFQIYTGSESESDRRITRSLILGQFEKALDICLEEDRMSDAFMVAVCGGERCIEKAQAAYFAKQSGGPNYLRLLASVVGKNLWDVVYNADLANWKEVMATLCTFADPKDYPDLCEALGDRLEDQMKEAGDRDSIRKDASFCFLAGSKLEKVVAIWIDELHGKEAAGQANRSGDSSFSIHTQALQNLIEKVTIFREVTRFQDSETRKTSDWKLAALYEKYIEYAEVVAAHGQIKVAEKYLDLLPTEYPLATMARHRVKQATRKDAPAVAARPPAGQATSTARTSSKPLPPIGAFQAQQSPARSQPALPYAPPAATQPQPANPYAPNANQYSNMGYQPPQQMRPPAVVPPPPQQFGASQYNQPTAPPPRAYSQSPSIPPPSQAKDMSNWNDIPDGFAKPTSRRGTPGIGQQQQPLSSPFPNQPAPFQAQQGLPPPAGPPRGGARQTPPVAPPPKGPPPPQRMSSPLTGGPPMERPSSSTAHMYAPSQTMSPPVQNIPPPVAPPIAPGPSPYNAPPSGPPPPNRYAPTPAAQQQGGPPQPPTSIPPPPSAASFQSAPAPINPYAPQARQGSMPASPYTPSSPPSQPMHQPPHQAVPQQPPQAPPQGPPSQGSRPGTATSQRRAPPSAPKYPPGDRTHIPSTAQPIFEILSSDMARVKARAPASFKVQVNDTEKRLNILFDHLNNEDLLKPDTVSSLAELAGALQARNYDAAQAIHLDILTNKTEECGQWMVGVKRLIGMSRATP